ncbi:hypothetical protein [Actinoplanes sp. NPDC051411]|uniref:hypothetical protein n=1 Tax=Actinoplanes sp. NPDC051411 TaxID=3155522 RepID=UPI00341A6D47
MALAVLHAGTVLDNPTYRKLTGLDSRIATSELQDLVARELVELLRKEGLVEATEKATSSRNTKYRRVAQGQLFS